MGKTEIAPATLTLALINAAVFLMTSMSEGGKQILKWGAMYMPVMEYPREYYRILTAMFCHFDIVHLTGNMISLIALGDILERKLGLPRFLLLYLISGIGAGIVSVSYNRLMGNAVYAAGASGAIFGLVGAMLVLKIRKRGNMKDIPVLGMAVMIAYLLYSGFVTEGVDNAAHVGGFLIGLLGTGLAEGIRTLYNSNRK